MRNVWPTQFKGAVQLLCSPSDNERTFEPRAVGLSDQDKPGRACLHGFARDCDSNDSPDCSTACLLMVWPGMWPAPCTRTSSDQSVTVATKTQLSARNLTDSGFLACHSCTRSTSPKMAGSSILHAGIHAAAHLQALLAARLPSTCLGVPVCHRLRTETHAYSVHAPAQPKVIAALLLHQRCSAAFCSQLGYIPWQTALSYEHYHCLKDS
jgi:hypothetical protein